MEITAGDSRSIEGETHVGKARANKLSIDSRVVGERGAKEGFEIIELISKDMLQLEAFNSSANLPKGGGIL